MRQHRPGRRAPNGFREGRARKADPSRNLGKERGREVSLADVAPYAAETCQRCRSRRGFDAAKNQYCRCATRRFLLAHPEVVVDRAGRAWWPRGGGSPRMFGPRVEGALADGSIHEATAREVVEMIRADAAEEPRVKLPCCGREVRESEVRFHEPLLCGVEFPGA